MKIMYNFPLSNFRHVSQFKTTVCFILLFTLSVSPILARQSITDPVIGFTKSEINGISPFNTLHYATTLDGNVAVIITELFSPYSTPVRNYILLLILSTVLYFAQRHREKRNLLTLNLEINQLTLKYKELSEKYKYSLADGNEKSSIESQDQRLLKKTMEIIESNVSDPLFGVEKMSKEMGMSRTNMHRKIKAITGFSPSELIRSIRLKKAAQLLLHQADSVAQISFAVGFEDHSYFSKSFKKQYGMSPSEYIQSNGQLSSDVINT